MGSVAAPAHHASQAPRAEGKPVSTQPASKLGERDIDALQAALDSVPAPLEPLDVSMLDGFLCGVLLQPRPVPPAQWLPHVTDADGRRLPPGFAVDALHALVLRRHAELEFAIGHRKWFDPWVFELQADGNEGDSANDVDVVDDDDEPDGCSDAVYPWVAGFAAAMEFFPALMALDARALTAPLALLYRHLDADDLEDADELIEEIDSLEPPADLSEAVEGLVRATLLLADVSRPLVPAARPARPGRPGHGGPPPRRPGPRR